jgi:galactitol-specific phosphotransferase system IIB component
MKHLVIGLGEVGRALQSVLKCDGFDSRDKGGYAKLQPQYDAVHICIPYGPEFKEQVRHYQSLFTPAFVVIHSTVPVGTSRVLGVLHSPIRGKHPNLRSSILTFKKYVAGHGAREMAEELRKFDIPAVVVEKTDDTEAGKLLDLMQFAVSVIVNKQIKQYCDANGIDFDMAYTHFNETYNRGYAALGMHQFIRPVLKHVPGKIGGHCVVQNMVHLDMELAKRVIKINETL